MIRRDTTIKLVGVVALVVATTFATAEPKPPAAWPEPHPNSYLGVHIDEVTPQTASALKLSDASGALITYVDQDGPACRAGLKNNDVVVGFNGSKIQNPDQLQDVIHATPAGKTVSLTVVRNGQKKDISVTLGAWPNAMAHVRSLSPAPPMAFMPPAVTVPPIPDIDIPSFTALSSRHGLVVENLCPQLSDFFGVPHGQGVLVRSVEKGSPADAAGLKAGDVIVKVNDETVHDMADWRRAMHVRAGKIPVAVVREKHEQLLVINLPTSGDTSQLSNEDWGDFEGRMQAFQQEMEKLRPELDLNQTEMLAQMQPGEKEREQIGKEIEHSMKLQQKNIEKMQKEIQKSVPSQKDLEKMQKQIEKSMKLKEKDIERMQRQLESSMPSQKDFEQLQRNIEQSVPSQRELEQMRREVDESMKTWTPQLQQEMEQLKKQIEQQKLDLQQMMKGFETERDF
jgi:membrane-associated protease RseP (regulator of RpoE activity)